MAEGTRAGDQAPRARGDVVFRSVGSDWVLYDPRTQDLHVLNATAAAVWACCDGTLGPDAIAREVSAHLPEAPTLDAVLRDVTDVLDRFHADGLLE